MKIKIVALLLVSIIISGCYTMQQETTYPTVVTSVEGRTSSAEIRLPAPLAPPPASKPQATLPAPVHELDKNSSASSFYRADTSVETTSRIAMVPKRQPASKSEEPNTPSVDWLANLQRANIILTVPESANINEDVRLELLLSLEKTLEAMRSDITESGVQHSDVIVVSRIVEVAVTAPDFDVKPITASRQLLSSSKTNSWKWTLRAKRSGVHSIDVSVTAVIEVSGTRTEHHIKTFNKRVDIEITPQQYLSQWFAKYWQWLASTIVIPLLLWWHKSRKRDTSST